MFCSAFCMSIAWKHITYLNDLQYRKTLKLHTLDMMRLWVYFTEGQRCFNSNNL